MNQTRACEMLIAAIINRALLDSFSAPIKDDNGRLRINHYAMSAMEFLSDHDNIFLSIINIEPATFWTVLTRKMFSKEHILGFTDINKQAFKVNYKLWQQRKAKTKLK